MVASAGEEVSGLRSHPEQEALRCHALASVRPQATSWPRNDITSVGSRSVYVAAVGLTCAIYLGYSVLSPPPDNSI